MIEAVLVSYRNSCKGDGIWVSRKIWPAHQQNGLVNPAETKILFPVCVRIGILLLCKIIVADKTQEIHCNRNWFLQILFCSNLLGPMTIKTLQAHAFTSVPYLMKSLRFELHWCCHDSCTNNVLCFALKHNIHVLALLSSWFASGIPSSWTFRHCWCVDPHCGWRFRVHVEHYTWEERTRTFQAVPGDATQEYMASERLTHYYFTRELVFLFSNVCYSMHCELKSCAAIRNFRSLPATTHFALLTEI